MFLATALIIPSVITLTYKKTDAPDPVPDEITLTDTEEEPVVIPDTDEETSKHEPPPDTDEEEEGREINYRPADETFVDRYHRYSEFDDDWEEEEERVLGPVTTAEVTTEPETTTAPQTTKPETTAPETTAPETTAPETTEPETTAAETEPADPLDNNTGKYRGCDAEYIKVYFSSEKKYVTMLLGDYIMGVIAAEMPTRFDVEALKAQAVACRTFTIYKSLRSSFYHSSQHGDEGADVCTNSGHCQAYKDDVKSKYSAEVYEKIRRAVIETSGVILTYNGEPIEAVYHATSYGMTDSMANIWGGNNPCLVGVETPETLDTMHVRSFEYFTSAEVKKLILQRDSSAVFGDDPSEWITIVRDEYDHVKTLTTGGISISGQSCRSVFGLASNNFKVSYDKENDKFTFEVFGWGHSVGMSQYGAGIYAEQGKDYKFIVKHYYSGADLTVWK